MGNIQVGERFDIPRNNADLPEARSYHHFRDILKKAETDPLIKTKIDSTTDFIIRPDDKDPDNTFSVQIKTKNGDEAHLCYIVGLKTLEDYIGKYFSEEVYMHQQEVKIQIMKEGEAFSVITGLRAETGELKDKVINYEFNDESIARFFDENKQQIEKLQDQYDHRHKEVNDQDKRRLKTSKLESEMFGLLKFAIKESQANVKRLDIQLKNLEKEHRRGLLNEPTWKEKTKEIRTALANHVINQGEIGQVINTIVSTSDQVMPDINIKLPITGSKHAEKVQNIYNRMTIERILTNNHTLKADIAKIQGQNNETLSEYLNDYLDTGVYKGPFTPIQAHEDALDGIKNTYPELAKYREGITDPKAKQKEKKRKGLDQTAQQENNGEKMDNNPEDYIKRYKQGKEGGLLDKLTPGFITDAIDNANIEPETKSRLKTLSGVALLIGVGVLAWKTVKGGRKAVSGKAESKDYARLAAGAALFGSAYVSSGNILNFKSLGKDVANLFSSNPDTLPGGSNDASPEQQITNGFNRVNILFGGLKYGLIKAAIKEKDGMMELDYDKFETILSNNPNIKDVGTRKKLLENMKNNHNPKLLHLALTTMGITYEALNDPSKADNTFNERASESLKNFGQVATYMHNNGYDHRNPELTKKIQTFISTGKPSLETLDRLGAFEKAELPSEDQEIKGQIDALTTLDNTEKKNLYYYTNRVHKELIGENLYGGEINIKEINGKIVIETYGEETIINPKTKSIINNKGTTITLQSTYEMVKAANLTNRFKNIFRGKSTNKEPFNISRPMGRIEFEKRSLFSRENLQFWKGETYEQMFDTTATARGSLKDISPTLAEKDAKDRYKDFLNQMDIRQK